jgi:AcrR family transcriptional regulator
VDLPLVPLGRPRGERADAMRNREHLLDVARTMLAQEGAEHLTMDCLAERAGLGKGTVFRRFGSRAGIFRALLDDGSRTFQERVLSGPPPLGPGAGPVARLIAFGRERAAFLLEHHAIVRGTLERGQPVPAGEAGFTTAHVRMLLRQADLGFPYLETLTLQLVAALEGPPLLYLSTQEPGASDEVAGRLGDSWQFLIERVCRYSGT